MKKLIAAGFLVLVSISSYAQATFQLHYGDTSHGEAREIIQTSDGNYAFIGSKIVGDSLSDIILTKMDTLRNIIFSIRDSTARDSMSKDDFGFDFKQTSDNGFIICGSTFGSPLDPDLEDILLIKTDQNGYIQWANVFSGTGTDRGYGLSIGYDGGYFISGFTNSGDSGFNQGVVIKVDFSGVPAWSKVNSIFNNSHFNDGCSTADSAFVAIGCAIDSLGSKDLFAVKYDNNGNVLWSKRFGSSGDQDGDAVTGTIDGGCIIAGYSNPGNSVHSTDMLVVKLDSSGTIQWAKTYNHLFEDRATNIVQLPDGNFVLSGFSNVTDTIAPVMVADFLKIDSLGDTLMTAMYGDALADNLFYSVTPLSNGGFLSAGISYGSGKTNGIAYIVKTDSTGGTLTCQNSLSLTSSPLSLSDNAGSDDDNITLIYSTFMLGNELYQVSSEYSFYDYCFSLATAEHHAVSSATLYPNPVQYSLNIDFHNSGDRFETLTIFDVFGRTVVKKKIQQNESVFFVDTEKFTPGIYQVELRGKQNLVTEKFVKTD